MGLGYSCFIALLPDARGRGPRGVHGWPPPNQPHQIVPTGWGDGWIALEAAFEAAFMPGAQLIHSGPLFNPGGIYGRQMGFQEG